MKTNTSSIWLPPTKSNTNRSLVVRHGTLPAKAIFGMVGRCGGGYNTIWQDWTPNGIARRNLIIEDFVKRWDAISNHYSSLEEDILENGMKNPIVITAGPPLYRDWCFVPEEIKNKGEHKWLFCEITNGASRLWVAQKHNMLVNCIINDQTELYPHLPVIHSLSDATELYESPPQILKWSALKGFYAGNLEHSHMSKELKTENQQDKLRRPIWLDVLKKYPEGKDYLNGSNVI